MMINSMPIGSVNITKNILLTRYLIQALGTTTEYLTLNPEQRAIYDAVMDSETHVFISSMPGCGKTYLAGVIARAISSMFSGTPTIIAVAPSHKAKSVLSESLGFEAQTIHKHCGYTLKESDAAITDREGKLVKVTATSHADVLILDEVSMTPNNLFQDAVDSATIVVALGDKNQLDVVSGEPADLSGFNEFILTQQMRQNNTGKLLFRTIDELKNCIETKTKLVPLGYDESLIKADSLSRLYINGEIDVIGAYTNAHVDGYNNFIQNELHGTTDICKDDKLVLQSPMKSVSTYKGKKIYPIVANNGDIVTVKSIGEKYPNSALLIDIYGYGKRLLVPSDFYKSIGGTTKAWEMYQKEFKDYEWSEFKAMTVNAKLPYAMTIHKMQGSTYSNVGIDINNIYMARNMEQRNRLLYVGISRAKHKCYVKVA